MHPGSCRRRKQQGRPLWMFVSFLASATLHCSETALWSAVSVVQLSRQQPISGDRSDRKSRISLLVRPRQQTRQCLRASSVFRLLCFLSVLCLLRKVFALFLAGVFAVFIFIFIFYVFFVCWILVFSCSGKSHSLCTFLSLCLNFSAFFVIGEGIWGFLITPVFFWISPGLLRKKKSIKKNQIQLLTYSPGSASVCLSVCLSLCSTVCLSVSLCLYLTVSLSRARWLARSLACSLACTPIHYDTLINRRLT